MQTLAPSHAASLELPVYELLTSMMFCNLQSFGDISGIAFSVSSSLLRVNRAYVKQACHKVCISITTFAAHAPVMPEFRTLTVVSAVP